MISLRRIPRRDAVVALGCAVLACTIAAPLAHASVVHGPAPVILQVPGGILATGPQERAVAAWLVDPNGVAVHGTATISDATGGGSTSASLGSGSFAVGAHGDARLRLSLTAAARQRLTTHGTIAVAVRFDGVDATGARTTVAARYRLARPERGEAAVQLPRQHAPVVRDDAYAAIPGGTLALPWPGVLANDTDADHDVQVASLVTRPAHAAAFALHADGTFTYVVAPGYAGRDSFTYGTSDGTTRSNVATVAITVAAPAAPSPAPALHVNAAQPVDDAYATTFGVPVAPPPSACWPTTSAPPASRPSSSRDRRTGA